MRTIVMLTALEVTLTVVLDGVGAREAELFVVSWARCGAHVVPEIPLGGTVIRARLRSAVPDGAPDDRSDVSDVSADDYRALADQLSGLITRRAIDARRRTLLMLHAGGVADPRTGTVIAFVGPSGRGKTTASIALGRAFGYVTDETLAMTDDLGVLAYGKPLSVKLPPPERWKDQVAPGALGLLEPPTGPLRLAGIVMLDRRDDHPLDSAPMLRPVSLSSAIAELVPQISYLPERPRPLTRLRSTIEQCGGLQQVTYREADTLVPLFRDLFSSLDEEAPDARGERDRVFEAVYDDAIRDDDALVVLADSTVRVLKGIAPTIIELCALPLRLRDVVAGVVEQHGTPEGGDPVQLVTAAVDELVSIGLLRASVRRIAP